MKSYNDYYPEVDGERNPLDWQHKFHAGITPSGKKATYMLLSGGSGCGMTTAVCADIAFHLEAFPGIRIAVLAPEYDTVQNDFIRSFQKIYNLPSMAQSVNTEHGSSLTVRHCQYPDTLRGFECHRAYMIEAAQFIKTEHYQAEVDTGRKIMEDRTRETDIGKEVFISLASRCRMPGDYPRGVVVQQNSRGHNWSYDQFIKPIGESNFVHSSDCNEWEYECDSNVVFPGSVFSKITYYTIGIPTHANTFLPR